MLTLHGTTFEVRETASGGVVGAGTRLHFVQRGSRVVGRYQGGAIRRGWLVGRVVGDTLSYRYAQTEADGHVHGGSARCDASWLDDGRIRLHEHFVWETRPGVGTNVFEQCR